MGINLNLFQENIFVKETADSIQPTVTNATMQFSGGILIITASEYVDSTPVTRVNLIKIVLVDAAGDGNVPMTGADILSNDGYTLVIDMSEAQRVAALRISDVTGGDGTQLKLDVFAGAFQDVAGNDNIESFGFLVNEIEDVIRPTITAASLNYSDGKVIIFASETVDATPETNVDLSLIWLAQETSFIEDYNASTGIYNYTYNGNTNRVSLVGATVTVGDETTVTLHRLLNKRAQLQYWSGTRWGWYTYCN